MPVTRTQYRLVQNKLIVNFVRGSNTDTRCNLVASKLLADLLQGAKAL